MFPSSGLWSWLVVYLARRGIGNLYELFITQLQNVIFEYTKANNEIDRMLEIQIPYTKLFLLHMMFHRAKLILTTTNGVVALFCVGNYNF